MKTKNLVLLALLTLPLVSQAANCFDAKQAVKDKMESAYSTVGYRAIDPNEYALDVELVMAGGQAIVTIPSDWPELNSYARYIVQTAMRETNYPITCSGSITYSSSNKWTPN